MHDFVRDSVRAALMKARPVPQFATEIQRASHGQPVAYAGAHGRERRMDAAWTALYGSGGDSADFHAASAGSAADHRALSVWHEGNRGRGNAALSPFAPAAAASSVRATTAALRPLPTKPKPSSDLAPSLASLKPLGQIRESFILAVNHEGLWIIDQHVAHERVLFEKILKQRAAQKVESQRLLMPLVHRTHARAAGRLRRNFRRTADQNGFEAEPFGARSIAVKIAPAGRRGRRSRAHAARTARPVFARRAGAEPGEDSRRALPPPSPAMPPSRSTCRWSRTRWNGCWRNWRRPSVPMSCPHGRPVVLRYSMKDIQKAFKRI